jgi:hypothetical protein
MVLFAQLIDMSQVSCPLCGKYTPETSFLKPREIHDINGAYMRGLGRGRGFQVTDRYSLMNDKHLTSVIADRCHRTMKLIDGSLDLSNDAILRNRDEWMRYAEDLKVQNDILLNRVKELEELEAASEEMGSLLEIINVETDFEFECLEDACDYLLELVVTL